MKLLIEEYGSILISCLAVMLSVTLLGMISNKYQSFAVLLIQGIMYH